MAWSLKDYAFLARQTAPRHREPEPVAPGAAQLHHGLFQVTERIYQVRGFELSNMTFDRGRRGVIVIDPLISTEDARAGLELYREHAATRPVTAVIYTHSHTDHYGGVRGVVGRGGRARRRSRSSRRSASWRSRLGERARRRARWSAARSSSSAATLPQGPRGQVDAGLGKVTVARHGHASSRPPR